MAQSKLWTRSLIVLMGVNFCSALSFYLIMVKIAEFAMTTYALPSSVAALAVSAYVIAALFTRLLFGGKIDAWGVKRSLIIGSAVNFAAMLLYLLPLDFALLMAVRVLHGFAFALMSGSAAAGAALVIPADRYGEGIGYFSMMQALATGVGPYFAIALTNTFGGYTPMFICAAAFAAFALASLALLKIPQSRGRDRGGERGERADGAGDGEQSERAERGQLDATREAGRTETTGKRGLASLVHLTTVPLASVLLLIYLGYAGILTFVTSYAAERGLTDAVSFYFVVYAVVILISRPPVGRRVDRAGENSVIYWCLSSLVVGLIVLAFASNAFMLLASAALAGFGIGATQSIVQAVIARDTPPAELGRANSTFFMGMDLGSGVGPIVIGAIIPAVGYSGSYLVLAAIALAAIALYYFVHGRSH